MTGGRIQEFLKESPRNQGILMNKLLIKPEIVYLAHGNPPPPPPRYGYDIKGRWFNDDYACQASKCCKHILAAPQCMNIHRRPPAKIPAFVPAIPGPSIPLHCISLLGEDPLQGQSRDLTRVYYYHTSVCHCQALFDLYYDLTGYKGLFVRSNPF